MAYQELDKGAGPNTNTGTTARQAADIINNQFIELYSRSFKLNQWIVTRWSYDVLNPSFDAFKDEDKIEGWVDAVAKDRYLVGIILVADGFVFPTDLDDPAKFFKLDEKLKIS